MKPDISLKVSLKHRRKRKVVCLILCYVLCLLIYVASTELGGFHMYGNLLNDDASVYDKQIGKIVYIFIVLDLISLVKRIKLLFV